MTQQDVFDALDGLMAYDNGCTDSGIRDEGLKRRVFDTLKDMDENTRRVILGRFSVSYYLCDEAFEEGYGIEDVKNFCEWLNDQSFAYYKEEWV